LIGERGYAVDTLMSGYQATTGGSSKALTPVCCGEIKQIVSTQVPNIQCISSRQLPQQ
jgi:hypothetical protein